MSSQSAEQQVLRYASDLARLYTQAEKDRRRLRETEERLVRVAGINLELMSALSLADAAQRLASAATDTLGLESAAVYLRRKERFALVGRFPESSSFPLVAPVTREDLAGLGHQADELASRPWTALTGGERAAVVPLPGRHTVVGFLAGVGELPHLHAAEGASQESLLSMLAAQAGVVFENHLMEERRDAVSTTRALRSLKSPGGTTVLGSSPAMSGVLKLVDRLSQVDSTILLTGETGTGKTLIAKLVHESGSRSAAPFVSLNCAAIPEALVESELFGHEAGAFTGARKRHRGKVEQAEGGTLFLDEIGELPLNIQTKLLSFLEDRRFCRVGGEEEQVANVRLVSATNRDLEAAVAQKEFRQDLLYRLNVFVIDLPPLRDRGSDTLVLARSLAEEVARRYGLDIPSFSPESERRLLSYAWPGNVRELRNVIEKAVILTEDGSVSAELLPQATPGSARPPTQSPARALPESSAEPIELGEQSFAEAKAAMVECWEIAYIRTLLRTTEGNIAQAARLARIDKKNLHRKLKKYAIDARDEAAGPA